MGMPDFLKVETQNSLSLGQLFVSTGVVMVSGCLEVRRGRKEEGWLMVQNGQHYNHSMGK